MKNGKGHDVAFDFSRSASGLPSHFQFAVARFPCEADTMRLIAVLALLLVPACEGADSDRAAPKVVAGQALPGAETRDPATLARLAAAAGPQTGVRSRHRNPDGTPRFTNRLVTTASPYLQQHAHNPVDWYPWGEEAFAAARRLNRPILLSVGYSTCHWCHVMEEESFEDEQIATLINSRYIAIKVDREERPDIDGAYMAALQTLTGSGGWPMTLWLTPEGEPFYAATYLPPHDGDRGTAMGFMTTLQRIADTWAEDPAATRRAATELTSRLRKALASAPAPEDVDAQGVLRDAASRYRARFDPQHGGVQSRQKFPSALPVRFLLRQARRSGDESSRTMATKTLEAMAAGGIHDQLGGGFHRYTVDPAWQVPHFEKMLYDNALLALAYLEGFQATGRDDFAAVARDTLGWISREMTAPGGAFHAATDADSPAPGGKLAEGWFFTWTPEEVRAALPAPEANFAIAHYGVVDRGEVDGRSVLHRAQPAAEAAVAAGIDPASAADRVEAVRQKLFATLAERPAPHRDDKIVTAWNGLAIAALARGSLVLGDPAYARSAARAADFLLTHSQVDGRLRRSWNAGASHHAGVLDDYAALGFGLIELYEATGELRWLEEAIALDQVVAEHFAAPDGGFYLTADDSEVVIARERSSWDGSEPSGASLHTLSLLRLAALTGERSYEERARQTLRSSGQILDEDPTAVAEMLLALDWTADVPREIVILTPGDRGDAAPFLAQLARTYLPNRVLTVVSAADVETHAARVPLAAGRIPINGRTTAYVCERRTCDLPTTDVARFAELLARSPRPAASAVAAPEG